MSEMKAKNFVMLTAFDDNLSPNLPRFCTPITMHDARVPRL